ncbi:MULTISPECIES: hypothetical protein [unclassified Ruminococcus]|uniref:hypothetical protein n=1 Tax=unclassified Ruminococcus TaxID=2608920 RepID=UPI00210BF397|nr:MULTISPECIES: hypothetical protein [unclassified Ruminococcus]MCQ4022911.1 hypothetical protein [Ruminococcus sp. zg-924]MCQ4115273.1 hypothetical protein [Ruminococcus sp. zg-921]
MKKHRFIGSCASDKFCIKGIDVFKYKWIMIGDVVIVIDPDTKQPLSFSAYKIEVNGTTLSFVAGKLYSGKWGFFDYEN